MGQCPSILFFMTLSDYRISLNGFYQEGKSISRIKDAQTLISIVGSFFKKKLKDVDELEFRSLNGYQNALPPAERKAQTIKECERFRRLLMNGVKSSLEGQTSKGLDKVFELLFSGKTPSVNTVVVSRGHDFYRMRSTDNYELFDRNGMFTMPFQLLEKQDTARYNKQGYPCLYLANSLYLTWEEMRRPDVTKANFSRFQNQRKMTLLDVTIPVKFQKRKDFVSAFLALICCANVEDDKKKYKFEYVTSNMILEAVIRANMENKCVLDGIRYISAKRFGSEKLEFENQTELMYNYVFPSMEFKPKGHSSKLENLFKLTSGRSLFLYNLHNISIRRLPAMTTKYKDTIFYELEQLSKKEPLDMI